MTTFADVASSYLYWGTEMKVFVICLALLFVVLLPLQLQAADHKAPMHEEFKPHKLVGDWKFVNDSTGRHYGGDIEVQVERINDKGIMTGRISYDGRQSNDRCGTKPLFADTPVPVEIVKAGRDYRITFEVNCQTGRSPRTFSWTLVCTEQGVCSHPVQQPWGKGVIELTVKP